MHELQPCHDGHSAYDQFPPDILHTLIGLLQAWASMVITIVAKIQKLYPEEHGRSIAVLEDLLLTYPYKQAMPFRVKHFQKGLSSICPGLRGKDEAKTTGYGDIGMIDNKDVPSLVLQLLTGTHSMYPIVPVHVSSSACTSLLTCVYILFI